MENKIRNITMKSNFLIGIIFIISVLLLASCTEKKEPLGISTHPDGWTTQSSSDFHGKVITSKSLSLESCQTCHGNSYEGGTSNVSCYSSGCHFIYPHPEGFANTNSVNSHDKFFAEINWNLMMCQSCHGADYAGMGTLDKNCLSCHNSAGGPEACNTCHGSKNNAAPPEDLEGNTKTTAQGVGAHQAHVAGTTLSTYKQGECYKCHANLTGFDDPAHIDNTPHAELNFGTLSTQNGQLNPIWDNVNGSCADVYCHGGFEFKKGDSQYQWVYTDSVIAGNNPTLYWKYVNTGQALCGSCHGLPPDGHIEANTCGGCHADVVDDNFNITNKFLHINGQIDVF
jgi:hypothetical protein